MLSCQVQTFIWIATSVDDDATVCPNGIKTLLANGLGTFFIKGNSFFSNRFKNLPKNPPDCPIFCNWVLNSFILAEEPFAKPLWSLKTCVLVNNNLFGKLISSWESLATFDESFNVTSVPYVNLLFKSYVKLRIWQFCVKMTQCHIESFYIGIILKQNKITILSRFLVKNGKWSLLFLE